MKHNVNKSISCVARSAPEELHNDRSDLLGDEEVESAGVLPRSDFRPETLKESAANLEEHFVEGPECENLEKQRVNNCHYCRGDGGDKDMKRALEHQAELIGRYEAEEKAQRDWEEKFRENNSHTPVCLVTLNSYCILLYIDIS